MLYNCQKNPYENKANIFGDKAGIYVSKTNIFEDKLGYFVYMMNILNDLYFCPMLLQENSELILLENDIMIAL